MLQIAKQLAHEKVVARSSNSRSLNLKHIHSAHDIHVSDGVRSNLDFRTPMFSVTPYEEAEVQIKPLEKKKITQTAVRNRSAKNGNYNEDRVRDV